MKRRLRALLALPRRDQLGLIEAWGWLLLAKIALKTLGLDRTLSLLSRRPGAAVAADTPAAARWVKVAARHLPGGATCLVNSLAVLGILHRRHIPAVLRVGVGATRPQLEAHAWVEVGGAPFNDSADVASRYRPFREPITSARRTAR